MYSLFSSLGTLLGHRLGTLMTVTVIGVAIAMPLGLYVAVANLDGLEIRRSELGSVSVFLEMGLDRAAVVELAGRIDAGGLGEVVGTVSPEKGLEQFRDQSGFGASLEGFDENPLPWVLEVVPATAQGTSPEAQAERLATWLEELDGVDLVQVDTKWLQRLDRILDLGHAVVGVLGLFFSLAVVVIVANTIRLDVAARVEEIQVLSLVGASDSFIRQPFMYSGFWYGLLGSVLALLLLGLSLVYLSSPISRLLDAYGSAADLTGPGLMEALVVLLGGGLLGLLGAALAVQRYLGRLKRGGLASI
jgi:cell division transport system permease protein